MHNTCQTIPLRSCCIDILLHCMCLCLVCSVGAEPTLFDLLRHVVPAIAARWKMVGRDLGVERKVLNTVRYTERRAEGCAMELLAKWLHRAPGTGDQPRTWHSLLGTIETVIGPGEKERIEAELQTLLSLTSDFTLDDNCQENVSIYIIMCQITIIAYLLYVEHIHVSN